ncbi:hypothetical protein Cgig2_010773 [Carnegiea gigantea]|uniref:C2H2-type domain-containing protein n=1 Tax=Carnegiea gigantea TaxID=171969 RepID=A0A9Q1JPS3_9CARY|nr:hypothetical protein Cgig2_010773 [Carnegiea gigantea]
MATNSSKNKEVEQLNIDSEDDEDYDDDQEAEGWEDWNADESEENGDGDGDSEFKCLFCESNFGSCGSLFEHCASKHHFDFAGIKKSLDLDFYGCFKLVNCIRRMVAQNTCWSCGHQCKSNQELQNHLHKPSISKELKKFWDDEKYLQPFMEGDSLLYSFDQDEDFEEDESIPVVDQEELMKIREEVGNVCIDDEIMVNADACTSLTSNGKGMKDLASTSDSSVNATSSSQKDKVNGICVEHDSSYKRQTDTPLKVSFANVAASEIRKVNESYFGSYSSFGIHREMLSDKVRMDAYGQAILKNPSLLNGATVLDVGCGTGILSLFAAQAGASRVIAVDASAKMASVATQIAKDNGLLRIGNVGNGDEQHKGVVEVVHGMVEDLDKSLQIEPHSIDVLLSEWMGYCLLYESMLSSVLYARDRWLKPGGAILPDTATMASSLYLSLSLSQIFFFCCYTGGLMAFFVFLQFAAGIGRGGTSLPFWENIYGFNMSCVGKELVEDAAQFPIVDVIDSRDIVTDTAVLQTFDLSTMRLDDLDFTSCIELQPRLECHTKSIDTKSGPASCHGIVLWFDTGFTSRFCRETPANLSTSPYTARTHWAQTILTFKEPIALSLEKPNMEKAAVVGTECCPASKIQFRISIARASQHRAIDISIEPSAVGHDSGKRVWPVQIFNLL